MAIYDYNILLDSEFTYQQYAPPVTMPTNITNVSGDVTIVTNINGATGGTINFNGAAIGYLFTGNPGGVVTMSVSNPALARAAINAAVSGANNDITSFSALTGNTGVNPWTGTPNGSSQSTYPATVASALYSQAEMQGLMDKMQDVTEFMMFLVAALLAPGIVET